jgi:signal transduction histidine kinase
MGLALAVLVAGCAAAAGDEAWRRAEAEWQRREAGAFAAWRALDPATPSGAAARRRLAAADAEYRRAIALLAAGDGQARARLAAATAMGPLDPALYLPLARACRDRGLDERAATLYGKFLTQAPPGPEADAARAELAALGDDLGLLLEPTPVPQHALAWRRWAAGVTTAVVVPGVVLAAWALRRARRRQRVGLAALAAAHAELQPAIAFLVGCLRHELLKHRVLAVGDAVRAGAAGSLGEPERRFLLLRLYGGEPLRVAWAGHLGAFMRALGPRFDLVRHDPDFAEADRALGVIAAAAGPLARGEAEAARRVLAAHERLVAFDAALARLAARLSDTVVDGALLGEVVAQVARELGDAGVAVAVTAPARPIAVEGYRYDVTLVLRNLVRNAVAAAARGPAPARVALDVAVAVEPTGEEVVRLRVRDSNPAPLPQAAMVGAQRGLGLVQAALQRCDGSLSVEPGGDGFAKAVVVRLFGAVVTAAEEAA